jgi:DNA-binding response OmpR family regulator
LLAENAMGPHSRVLVVDDEPAIRALVAKIVARAGHPVDTARDGAEAIEKIGVTDYSVIVLDLMMPNVDGYGLLRHLKSRGGVKPAVIVISAGDSAALRQLDASMVHSILRKPFDIDVLGDLITAAAEAAEENNARADSGDVLPFPKTGQAC